VGPDVGRGEPVRADATQLNGFSPRMSLVAACAATKTHKSLPLMAPVKLVMVTSWRQ